MFFAKIPRHTRQNAITEGDSECILTRNCESTEQLRKKHIKEICGINSFRHRQRRRPASSWTKHAIIKNNRHQKRRDKICKSVYY